jgi:RNA polymerase sigma-70 factor (sigma-E family)
VHNYLSTGQSGGEIARPNRDGVRVTASRPTADDALERLYAEHWTALVRLAALLLRDRMVAEEVVQDAFVALHSRWDRLRDADKAVAYLRRSVVNGCRSQQRRAAVVERHRPEPASDAVSAETTVLAAARRDEVLTAVAQLSRRQREVLVLRHWLALSEAEIAAVLRISRGSVKTHSSRGLDALRSSLEHDA